MFLECNHLTKDNIMGWVFQNLTERTKGSKNIPRKGNVLRKQNKVSRGKVESLKNIFFLSFLFSFKRFLQTWIKFIGLYIFYYYLVFFVSFIMFYEMCFTGLVPVALGCSFITSVLIIQQQRFNSIKIGVRGWEERLKNSRIMLERGVQMDFTLKDILKAFNNFKHKQQKCMK